MPLRLDPVDEYPHPVGPEINFNESVYFNFYDRASRLGAFIRLGNRPNEGHGEMTVCLYLPDGRIGFMFSRPKVQTERSFDAGAMRVAIDEPFERLTLHYAGEVCVLSDPKQMAEPRAAFAANPHVECSVSLTVKGGSDVFGGEPVKAPKPGEEQFARAHYEQLIAVRGEVAVGEQSWTIDGFGLRDHSWGPRSWQAPWYYRWATANFGPDFAIAASQMVRADGRTRPYGFVWVDGQLQMAEEVLVETLEMDEVFSPLRSRATVRCADRTWVMEGRTVGVIPLRNRRTTPDGDELVTRIAEGLTEWTLDDGRIGYGLVEFLDQVIDGRPVGVPASP